MTETSLLRRGLFVVLAALLIVPWATLHEVSAQDSEDDREFFGMVSRDPWYEYSTFPTLFPNEVNRAFLERMVSEMAEMGVRWIRFEVRAESDHPDPGPGPIDWSKHDWFLNELLPRYDMKPLMLLGSGVLGDEDERYEFHNVNDTPDAQGRNDYTEAFVDRVSQIASRYGSNIGAYEILNEPNHNQILSWETGGEVEEVDPEIYGRLAIDSYNAIKSASPESEVVAGALLHNNEDGSDRHFDWLDRVYQSEHIQDFVDSEGRFPWDGVSIHPYFLNADGVVQHVFELRWMQESNGDEDSLIWVSEIGVPAESPSWTNHGIMDPTQSELDQGAFLDEVYSRLQAETPFVARVFWFKYEDFGEDSYSNWGLVRLRDADFKYGPYADPWPRKHAYGVYQSLARPEAYPTSPQPRPSDEGERVRYFEATGQTLRDPFLEYWEDHGGLAMFGYPKTKVFEVRGRKVQYFERARFEYWPEHAGTQWEVQLGLLGRYETRGRTFDPQPSPDEIEDAPNGEDENGDDDNGDNENGDEDNGDEENGDDESDDRIYFPQTRQYLGGAFRDYWENNGGLDIFGYPISPEIEEVNPADGNTYVVQYFERARFEHHPEHAGTEHEVQLGLLGNQVLENPGWYR